MTTTQHLDTAQIDAAIAAAGPSPSSTGTIEMIVVRPTNGERAVVDEVRLEVGSGAVGDNYVERGDAKRPDGSAHPEAQLNIMGSRRIDAVAAGDRSRWPLAGDQFFVDLDLSTAALPVGTRLGIGDAVIEVAAKPHTGCAKFSERFGIDAARWVNQEREERRRGLCAMVVAAGLVRVGDAISVIE